jgi:hypothetical protein
MGKHYVWHVKPEAMVVRLQPRGLNLVEGYLAANPLGGPIAGQAAGPSASEIMFQLSAADVQYLLSRPGNGTIPKLRLACSFIKFPDPPANPTWGYRLQIAQPGGPVTGIFSDGSSLVLDSQSFHRSGMHGFAKGEDVAYYRIVMEFRAGEAS